MNRSSLLLLCLLATFATGSGAWAQGPGGQHEAYFPPPAKPRTSTELSDALRNLMKEMRAGSGPDRVEVRGKMMARYESLLGAMLVRLQGRSKNHFEQRHICLVLMQMGDARALDALRNLSGSGKGGTRGLAGLALGRLDDPGGAVSALEALSRSGQPMDRKMAYLALGRLGGQAAADTLMRRMDRRPSRELEAVVIGLGLTGSGEVARFLRPILLGGGKGDLRRAAAVGAGYLDQDVAWELLRDRVSAYQRKEQDKKVRIIALRGMARFDPDPKRYKLLLARRPNAISDADEEAAWVLALAALGGRAEFRTLAGMYGGSVREEVREALAAATIVVGGRQAAKVASALLTGQEKDRVVRAALLAGVVHARDNAGVLALQPFAKHTDEQVRRVALCGDVYLRGSVAEKTLRSYLKPEYKDDVRKLAKQLLGELVDDELATRMLCRARLQWMLDQNGLAASWNLNRSATERIYEVLDIEDATDRRGSGQPPGGRPSGRPAPPATGPTQEQEDLRRHLDRYPYIDLRHRIEVPAVE